MHEMTIRLIAVLLRRVAGVAQAAAPALPGAEWTLDQIKLLSAPGERMAAGLAPGRADRAARHVADRSLPCGGSPAPVGGGGTYLQGPLQRAHRHAARRPSTRWPCARPAARAFTLGTDFTPLTVSTDGAHAEGEVVFAGYGRSPRPICSNDDYAGLQARDRIVIAS